MPKDFWNPSVSDRLMDGWGLAAGVVVVRLTGESFVEFLGQCLQAPGLLCQGSILVLISHRELGHME